MLDEEEDDYEDDEYKDDEEDPSSGQRQGSDAQLNYSSQLEQEK